MRTSVLEWPAARTRAVRLLREGGCVAFPAETVYGLGARFDDEEAVRGIFWAKGRPPDKALIVHVLDVEDARRVAADVSPMALRLAEAFWPGPLTLVLPKGENVCHAVTAGGATVAVRATSHPVARSLIEAVGVPLAAPSANPTGGEPPTTAEEVIAGLDGRISLTIDGGPTPHRAPSTVLDVSRGEPCAVVREGAVARVELSRHVELA